MNKPFALLLCLFLALTVQEIKGSSFKTLVNAWASQNGEVSIQKDSNGYYVDVDYSYYPYSSYNMTRMMLSLSNSDTLFGYSCGSFDNYYCNQHNCTEYIYSIKNIDYPSFSASTHSATLEAYLDYQNWKLRSYGYISQNCSGGSSSFGYGRGGVIGLGTSNSINFIGSNVFSVYFDQFLNRGKLLFKYDSSLGSGSAITFNADSDWKTSFTNGYVHVGYYQTYFSGNMIFDIHAKAIGFPSSIFQTIMTAFRNYKNMYCSTDLTYPTCNYYGYISNLPNIKLSIQGQLIEIPPTVYVRNPSKDYVYSVVLNLQALSPTMTGSNFVTTSFKDSVILDAQFLSYYYAVFSNKYYYSNEIKLIVLGSTSGSNITGITGIVVFIFVASICCCVFKKKKPLPAPSAHNPAVVIQPPLAINNTMPVQPISGYGYPQNAYPVVNQYAQQPVGVIQQPGYYAPPQQFQQPGYTNYGN